MNVYEFARKHLGQYKIYGSEIKPLYCPFCHGGQHKDKETFALNIDKLTYNCKRGKCGKQGHFSELCREFGEEMDRPEEYRQYKQSSKTYKKPQTVVKPLENKAEEYLKLRKISNDTMTVYKIGCNDNGDIVFPFYDEKGEFTFAKFRPARKILKGERKAWREADTKPILFGMNLCSYDYPLCIFEGEIDAMSGFEAGIKNCVSVPSGAEDFTWVDTCWDWINEFESIYIFGDTDEPGQEMVKKICLKFEDKKCYTVENKYKDANELLFREGKEAVKHAYDNAKLAPIDGVLNLAEVKAPDIRNMPKVRANISRLDEIVGGFRLGELSVWTGKRASGKSTFIGQLLLEAIEQGMNVFAYSGELRAEHFQFWIMLQAAGHKHVTTYYDTVRGKESSYVSEPITEKINKWIKDKFWLYDNQSEVDILKAMQYSARRYDCKVFLVDNLMTAGGIFGNEKNFYKAQSDFVGVLVKFAKKYNVHVHLVAHPRKSTGNSLDNDDVSGSGDITNRADNVFSIERKEGVDYSVELNVLKNRFYGDTGSMALIYNKYSRRMFNNDKEYSWTKVDIPEQTEFPEFEKSEDEPF